MKIRLLPLLSLSALISVGASAAVSEDEADRLGADLTPLGGEVAGNEAGTIPAWDGGITTAPSGYTPGDHHPDPYGSEQPLFTITAANLADHRDQVTAGHAALLEAYPDYKLVVYPTHRSAANPQRIYDATRRNATTASLINDGAGFANAIIGTPVSDPAKRSRSRLESPHSLPWSSRRSPHWTGHAQPPWQLHVGRIQRRVPLQLRS